MKIKITAKGYESDKYGKPVVKTEVKPNGN